MRTMLQSQGLWSIVNAGYIEADDESSLSTEEKEQLEINHMKDAKALYLIQQGVAENIFPRIMRAEKAKEAWEIIQKEFEGDSKVRNIKLQSLRRELENLKMKEAELMKDYFTKVMEIVNQMRIYGENITDQRIVEKILISLPEKYDYIVAAIEESNDISVLSVQELMSSLLSHEQRKLRHSEQTTENAFQSKLNFRPHKEFKKNGTGYFRGGEASNSNSGERYNRKGMSPFNSKVPCKICKKSNHSTFNCWWKGKPQCNICKKFGHISSNCRFKDNQANFTEKKEEGNLFYACLNTSEEKENI